MAGAAALHVRWRPKTPTTDAAPGTLAISAQLRRSCRPVWANDALDHARDSRAAGCPDEEWEQDATMKATLHERDADHDELLRRGQVQPDDVADQQRPQALEFLRRDRSVPAYSRISLRTWAFTGRLAVLPPILGWLTIVAD